MFMLVIHPDPLAEPLPLRGQTPTLRIPHTPGIPRRSPIVSPYDNPALRSVDERGFGELRVGGFGAPRFGRIGGSAVEEFGGSA